MNYEEIARVCHEANRALQIIQADPTIPVSPPWDELDDETQASIVDGVRARVERNLSPAAMHHNWCLFKMKQGWTHGEVKDEEAKTHPLLVAYNKLPASQKLKDELFSAIVDALAPDRKQAAFVDGFRDGRP